MFVAQIKELNKQPVIYFLVLPDYRNHGDISYADTEILLWNENWCISQTCNSLHDCYV